MMLQTCLILTQMMKMMMMSLMRCSLSWMMTPGLSVAHHTSSVPHNDQSTSGVNIAVAAGHCGPVTLLFSGNVSLSVITSHIVVKTVRHGLSIAAIIINIVVSSIGSSVGRGKAGRKDPVCGCDRPDSAYDTIVDTGHPADT